ncbi:hypothetical protein [Pseudomonas sp. KNUC1026]|uniref:hypothetical protein n=1 Tax=Pseudomonas sp. KNUC1026 TaxID=2893890 RepID=UPI001F2E40A2|nr:hypothetical protein [Pseudomonas sp. KNUC1026]UFH48043.1 hypothetical protein LN139_12475 [Pseudomonas sp. KNUC1026]
MFWMVFFAALVLPGLANAQIVQRCVATDGQALYTFGACPDGSAGISVRAFNPPPGSSVPRARPVSPRQPVPLTIVGQPPPAKASKPTPERSDKATKKQKRARYQPPALAQ